MKKKKQTKSQIKKIQKKEKQAIFDKLQQILDSYNNPDLNNANRTLLHMQISSHLENTSSTSILANENNREENITSDNKCYRCKHFLQISQNLSQTLCKGMPSFVEEYQFELNFVKAIIWLKSVTTCIPQIPVRLLQQIFNRQQMTHKNYRYGDNKYINDVYIDQSFTNKDDFSDETMMYERNYMKNLFTTSSPLGILNLSNNFDKCTNITPQTSIYNPDISRNRDTLSPVCTNIINKSFTCKTLSEKHTSSNVENESKFLPFSTISDTEFSLSSEIFNDLLNNLTDCPDKYHEKITTYVDQPTLGNSIESIEKKSTKNIAVAKNKSNLSQSYFSSHCSSVFSMLDETFVLSNEHEPVTPKINRFTELSPNLTLDSNSDKEFTSTAKQSKSCHELSPIAINYSPEDSTRTNTSQISNDAVFYKQKNHDNSQIHRATSNNFTNDKFNFNTKINNLDNSDLRTNIAQNLEFDSAYETLSMGIHNYDLGKTINSNSNKRPLNDTINHNPVKLLLCKEKMTHTEEIKSSFIPPREETEICCENQSFVPFTKRYKLDSTTDRIKEEKEQEKIPSNWLNFILETLNVERAILDSVKIILSALSDRNIAKEYAKCKYWKNTLEKEAVDTVLNVSDILRKEKKPNICQLMIVTTIVEVLNELTTCVEKNKTSVWIYHVQIILELCNSLSICVEIIDYLIEKLKFFEVALTDATKIEHTTIDQLHRMFYALKIVLTKYRTIVPRNRESESFAKIVIPQVADRWKTRYTVSKELEDINLNPDVAEKKWSIVLETFTVTATKTFNLLQFAEKSRSLTRILTSQ